MSRLLWRVAVFLTAASVGFLPFVQPAHASHFNEPGNWYGSNDQSNGMTYASEWDNGPTSDMVCGGWVTNNSSQSRAIKMQARVQFPDNAAIATAIFTATVGDTTFFTLPVPWTPRWRGLYLRIEDMTGNHVYYHIPGHGPNDDATWIEEANDTCN